MLSYHNDPSVKQKYVERFEQHRIADQVIQGTGYDNGRGCFVGCTLENYDHSRFPIELGWPEWLAHLADSIFEGLPEDEAPEFGSRLLTTVPVGVDLEPVRHILAIRRLTRLLENTAKLEIDGQIKNKVLKSIQGVIICHEAEQANQYCDWSAAESAAWSAESAARSAAMSAAESAARSAAESAAWSAESAARSAAWSAESAARSAARSAAWSAESAAWRQERDDLLDILKSLGE